MLGGRGAAAGVLGVDDATGGAERPTDTDRALVLPTEAEGAAKRTDA